MATPQIPYWLQMKCHDCDVLWLGPEPCFCCGSEGKPLFKRRESPVEPPHPAAAS